MLNKNRLTLIFCSQCCLKCLGGYVSYHEIKHSGEENERSELCNQSCRLKIAAVKKLFGLGLINLRIFFLKIPKFSDLRWLEPRLFHSLIADGKKELL